jgi:hypothetical protein
MSRVGQLVVPPPTSALSATSTRRPGIAASRPIAAPLMPAPMTITSNSTALVM